MRFVIISVLLFCSYSLPAQGGWNIGYLHIDSVNQSHTGWKVKPDFKKMSAHTGNKKNGIREFVRTRDTTEIMIKGQLTRLIEQRKIYVDHGSYQDQWLQCANCTPPSRIDEARILAITRDSISFEMEFLPLAQPGTGEKTVVTIEKKLLDGLMYPVYRSPSD